MTRLAILCFFICAHSANTQQNIESSEDQYSQSISSTLITGVVTDLNNNPITGIKIYATGINHEVSTTTDSEGIYLMDLTAQTYTVHAGSWGFLSQAKTYNMGDTEVNFNLTPGYMDSFILDQGWSITGDAETGVWTREVPIGTDYNDWPCNPEGDSPEDAFGDFAYVTGNAGGSAGNDDIDNGATILRSLPMDLSNMSNPRIAFDFWFFNDGGNGNPNDEVTVNLIAGSEVAQAKIIDKSFPVWFPFEINPAEFLSDLSEVIIEFNASDFEGSGHLVEAGLDHFRVYEGTSSIAEITQIDYAISPNPFEDQVQLSFKDHSAGAYLITDINGKIIANKTEIDDLEIIDTSTFSAGIYFIQVYGKSYRSQPIKLVKM